MTHPAPTGHQTYPCGSCGSQLQFAPGTTALSCPYCGAQQQIRVSQRKVAEHDHSALGVPSRGAPDAVRNLFVCTGCGVHTESEAWSDVCQFCGAPVVADQSDPNAIAPGGVVPFRIDKSGARQALREWVGSRWFAPNKFRKVDEAESLKSTYLPHWTWDADTRTTYTGERGDDYYVEGGSAGERERRTRWRPVRGTVERSFDGMVVPATTHVSPKRLEGLSRDWSTEQVAAYQPEYLSGHHIQRYDIGPDQGLAAAKGKMADAIQRDVKRDIGGDQQRVHTVDTKYSNITCKLLLLPVWLLAYLFGGKTWQVMVSGQSGAVIGERPWSAWKITFAVLVTLIVVGVIGFFYHSSG